MFYENLELLREKNPFLAFSLGEKPSAASLREEKLQKIEPAEVSFIYDWHDPTPFIEREAELCFIFKNPSDVVTFLQNSATAILLKNPKVHVVLPGENEEEYKVLGWRYLFMKRVHILSSRSDEKVRDRLEQMLQSIELVASDYREYGVDILRNVYENLLSLDEVIFASELKKEFPKRPAIVCGAGPSLIAHLEELKSLETRVIILGCGSAIPILMKAGIRPHLAAFVDPNPPLGPFQELEDFTMPLFYQNRMSKDILKLHKGAKVWMGSSGGYLVEDWLDEELGFPELFFDAGWNVANFGMRALTELGASSIYFLGVDGCYDKEVMEPHEWKVEDVHGSTKVTRKDLFMGTRWIADFAKSHPDVPIINMGGSGLIIDAVNGGTLQIMKEKLPIWHPKEVLAYLFQNLSRHKIDRKKGVDLLLTLHESLFRMEMAAKECLEIFQRQNGVAAFALFDVEIKDEIAHNLLLEPLWNIWKHLLLRHHRDEGDLPYAKGLQEVLFFHRVIEKHLSLINEILST